MRQVVSADLLALFCAPELQVVISGASQDVSLPDMRAHTRYAGGYSSLDRNITRFWAVVEELSKAERAALLKFITSCERPPSLGFADLQVQTIVFSINIPITHSHCELLRSLHSRFSAWSALTTAVYLPPALALTF